MSNLSEIDINNVCRTCLSSSSDMKSLFEMCSHDSDISFVEILMSLTQLKCLGNDGLSTQICPKCNEELKRFYKFKCICLESNERLRSHLDKVVKTEEKSPFEEKMLNIFEENTNEQLSLSDPLSITEMQTDLDQQLDVIKHEIEESPKPTEIDVKPKKKHPCTVCERSFKLRAHLTGHMRTHTGEKPYACTMCDKSFSANNILKRHIATHTGERPYACTMCDHACFKKAFLKVHMRKHTGEKPYSCTVCDSVFSLSNSLALHMRTHTGEKPYSCTMCDSEFSRRNSLTLHMRIHTGEKPYSCPVCKQCFARRPYLTYHLKSHAKNERFSCTICGKTFKKKGHLQRHMLARNVHKS